MACEALVRAIKGAFLCGNRRWIVRARVAGDGTTITTNEAAPKCDHLNTYPMLAVLVSAWRPFCAAFRRVKARRRVGDVSNAGIVRADLAIISRAMSRPGGGVSKRNRSIRRRTSGGALISPAL